jgi:hypothetical protein
MIVETTGGQCTKKAYRALDNYTVFSAVPSAVREPALLTHGSGGRTSNALGPCLSALPHPNRVREPTGIAFIGTRQVRALRQTGDCGRVDPSNGS